jgi:hypothetical protein
VQDECPLAQARPIARPLDFYQIGREVRTCWNLDEDELAGESTPTGLESLEAKEDLRVMQLGCNQCM